MLPAFLPDALEIYSAFIQTISRLQQESPEGSDSCFVVPAFAKPSHNGDVTFKQCCVVRFWSPVDIPGPSRDLAERMQLRCFPLFPQSLDWRRAMEPVAQRSASNGSASACAPRKHGKTAVAGVGRITSSCTSAAPSEASMLAYCARKQSAPCGEREGYGCLATLQFDKRDLSTPCNVTALS